MIRCSKSTGDVNASRHLEVVGAGPAGLAAALTTRAGGASVTVYERRPSVGARFHGDFQGIENWTTDEDVVEELARAGLSLETAATGVHEVICLDSTGVSHTLRSPGRPLFYLVKRGAVEDSLDTVLARQALKAGAVIRLATRRDQLSSGGIVAEGPHAADVIAVGHTFTTDMADGCYVSLSDALAPGGYAYLLIQGGFGTVAACLFRDFHEEKMHLERTVAFFRRHAGLRWQQATRFGGSGNVTTESSIHSGSVLYAGESAGLQDALFGFGLRYALLSGHFAANAWLAGSNALYERLWRKRIRRYVCASLLNRRLYQLLGDRGRGFFLRRVVVHTDPRHLLMRIYRPSRCKVMLGTLLGKRRLTQRIAMAECSCTWCRCHAGACP